jgi:hypothetical protein
MEVPRGFEGLRKEILSFGHGISDSDKISDEGRMGLFMVHTHDFRGTYITPTQYEQAKVSTILFLPLLF